MSLIVASRRCILETVERREVEGGKRGNEDAG